MLVIGCDELRERAERGEGELTCERVCRALRSCGRHECGRVVSGLGTRRWLLHTSGADTQCCPLAYQAKNRGKKRPNDDAVADDSLHVCHLTCGKLLSCGTHTCPKPDHKGACGRCLQASYDELVCHCGHTVVYPPVAW
jgi:transcriptional repressor NF-X1